MISRGTHAVFPLAAVPVRRNDRGDVAWQLAGQRYELKRACVHFFGGDDFHQESELDPETGYGKKLGRVS